MKKKILFSILIVTLILIGSDPAGAIKLYDDFDGSGFINSNKWLNSNQQGSYVNEFVREIDTDNDVLVLKIGRDNAIYMPRNELPFQNPAGIDAIRTDVKIVSYNSDPTYDMPVYARAGGRFYNSDSVGDIGAFVSLGSDDSGLAARYVVFEQTTTTGETSVIESGIIVSGLNTDVAYTLEIIYNGANGFTFRISGGGLAGPVEATASGPARAGDSLSQYKALGAWLNIPGLYGSGYIHAEFDNVYVNGALYDAFDAADTIDVTKWVPPYETVNEIRGGQLAIQRRGGNTLVHNTIPLRDRNTNYLEATIQLESGSSVNAAAFAHGQARIMGRFYNQTGIDNGYQDDVVAFAGIQLNSFGNLSAFASVAVVDINGNFGSDDIISSESFTTIPIGFDTDYTFSIFFDENNKQFVFKCSNDTTTETLTYGIITNVFPTKNPFRWLGTSLILDTDESGYLKARFDEVYVDDPIYDLTGDWSSTTFNGWVADGCSSAHSGNTSTIQVMQSDCEVEVSDPSGEPFGGVISGTELLISGLTIDDPGFGGMSNRIAIDLSSAGSGAGTMQWENAEGCYGGWDILISTGGTAVFLSGEDEIGVATSEGDLTLTESTETPPDDLDFLYALMDITVTGIAAGATVDVTIDLPDAAPAGASVYKLINGVWTNIDTHVTFNPQRTSFTFQIIDNGWGDNDNIASQISDPVGIATAVITPSGTPTGGGSNGGGGGCFIDSFY